MFNFKYLKKAYNKAVEEKKETFSIDELVFLTSYAKYAIEFLNMSKVDDKVELSRLFNKSQ